jgi:hypothetical protein
MRPEGERAGGGTPGNITFEKDGALALADALAAHIQTAGFGALSKTDFYDYVLSLLDTYSREHFFSRQSNQENALLLKVSPAKIKASRLNIYLKFVNHEKQEDPPTGFIRQIAEETITLKDDGINSGFLRLTVEDPVIRFRLDGAMKEYLKISPDIRLNSEILVMEKGDFYTLLRTIIENDPVLRLVERETILQRLDQEQTQDGVKKFFHFLLDAAAEAGDKIPLLPAQTIKEGITTFFDKLVRSKK